MRYKIYHRVLANAPEIGHAIGQACGVVHANGHAIGFPIYDLTAIIRNYGVPECKRVVEERKQQYIERIYYWREHYKDYPYEWADFMMDFRWMKMILKASRAEGLSSLATDTIC